LPGENRRVLSVTNHAVRYFSRQNTSRTAESAGKGQLGEHESNVSGPRGKSHGRVVPRVVGSQCGMDDAGAGQNGTGYNLPNVERVELQTFIQLRCESVGLGPGGKLTKLLFDNGSGTTFDRAANHSAVSPKLRGKSKSFVHSLPVTRIDGGGMPGTIMIHL